ncbi:PilZ domain-containing protein [Stappia sp. WLB 29]|uniref:PilZ domain-containing protein n=1 Tax=Stappia sp. WLB 29 TaxID=2925220 RepID=UPI0020BDFF90|nr:PilZ domain-containing protein [Stappia sp. WLB 29]
MAEGEDEARRSSRVRTLKQGRLVLAGKGGFGIDCRIVNLSAHGARLKLETPLTRSEAVDLVFLPENIRTPVKVIWQEDNLMGVEFSEPLTWLKNLT